MIVECKELDCVAYKKSGTRDPGHLQVGPWDLGPKTPKCLGGTQDPEPPKWDPGLWEPGTLNFLWF